MINDEIRTIQQRIQNAVSPKRIYLFGSFAKNTFNDDSDYDFYVIVPDGAGDRLELSQKAYRSLRGARKRPVDIVLNYESSFRDRAEQRTLEQIVSREGILLYDRQ